jgi:hypothetical protein
LRYDFFMQNQDELSSALRLLGEILGRRALSFDLVVIGGGALLLQDLIDRPTFDLDAVGRMVDGKMVAASPLPENLVRAIRDVAEALDLPREPRDEKDWLNGGPTVVAKLGLPPGFRKRVTVRKFGPLTIRVAGRRDLVFLKLWAATDSTRGARREVDIADLKALGPTKMELRDAINWCRKMDGRQDFLRLDVAPVVDALGFDIRDLAHE